MAKQYGIHTYEKDNTPGFRSSGEWDTWFASQDERDRKYDYLVMPHPVRPDEIWLPDNMTTYTYTKIERDVADS